MRNASIFYGKTEDFGLSTGIFRLFCGQCSSLNIVEIILDFSDYLEKKPQKPGETVVRWPCKQQPISDSRGIRDRRRNPPKCTEKRIRINFPFPCLSVLFRGYAFVMIFLAGVILISLARSWGRASGVSRSGPDSVRAAPESSRRRAAGRYAQGAEGFQLLFSLMALVNRRRQLGAICSNGATCTRASSRPLR